MAFRVRARSVAASALSGSRTNGAQHARSSRSVSCSASADPVAFVVHAPGAPMELFTRAAAALAVDGALSMEAVLDVAARNGIELLGPVPDEF